MWTRNASLFDLYRWLLTLTVCTYAAVRFVTAAWRWYVAGLGARRREALLRSYIVTILLRVRARRFWFEFVQICVLSCVLAYVLLLHE